MRTWFKVLAMLLVLWAVRCSVPDGGDMAALEREISALPPEAEAYIREFAARQVVREWLAGRPRNDKVGWWECQNNSGTWDSVGDVTVGDILRKMLGHEHSFDDAFRLAGEDLWGATPSDEHEDWDKCRGHYVPAYAPDVVAAEARGASKVNSGDMNRLGALLSLRQIANALISSDAPPALPGGFGQLRFVLPALCAMGDNWGCPDHPAYPRDEPQQGDQ